MPVCVHSVVLTRKGSSGSVSGFFSSKIPITHHFRACRFSCGLDNFDDKQHSPPFAQAQGSVQNRYVGSMFAKKSEPTNTR